MTLTLMVAVLCCMAMLCTLLLDLAIAESEDLEQIQREIDDRSPT
jgi:hypothetical protein